jgi:hypothetical protein
MLTTFTSFNNERLHIGRTTPAAGRTWSTLSHHAGACPNRVSSSASEAHCALVAHLHWVWQYQSESHYWSLQWVLTAIFEAAALAARQLARRGRHQYA